MQQSPITPQMLALPPAKAETDLEKIGQKMLLQRAAGYTNGQLSLIYSMDEQMIADCIQAAIDDNILQAMLPEVRDQMFMKTLLLDQELAELSGRLPDVGQKKFQAVGKIELTGHDEDCETGCKKKHTLSVPVDLVEDVSNIAAKISIIKERRQLILTQKVLMGTSPGERGAADRDSEMNTILKTVGAVAGNVMDKWADRLSEVSRQRGRLEGQKESTIEVLPDNETLDSEG